jgi:hypothetical protein
VRKQGVGGVERNVDKGVHMPLRMFAQSMQSQHTPVSVPTNRFDMTCESRADAPNR